MREIRKYTDKINLYLSYDEGMIQPCCLALGLALLAFHDRSLYDFENNRFQSISFIFPKSLNERNKIFLNIYIKMEGKLPPTERYNNG